MMMAPMQQPRTPKDRFPLYPFLFAVYPILFLYARNQDLVRPADMLRPGAAALGLALILLLAARAVTKSWQKAGVLTSIVLLLFFSYGHVVDGAVRVINGAFRPGLILFPLWLLAMAAALALLLRTRRPLAGAPRFLRAFAVVLTVIPVVQIGVYLMGPEHGSSKAWDNYVTRSTSGVNALKVSDRAKLPDIYYIILDAYSRADFLKESEGFDNSEFINFLKEKGFYVAEQSRSNYLFTTYSIPSSLNMDYIDKLAREAGAGAPVESLRLDMFGRPRAVRLLRDAGYTIVELPFLYARYCLADPDVRIRKGYLMADEFNIVLVDSTMLRVLDRCRYRGLREVLVDSLDLLAEVPEIEEPTFTFAHVPITHHPFFFHADGTLRGRILSGPETETLPYEEFSRLYVESIELVNSKMKQVVQEILDRSETPPIIIIQGDHGRWRPTGQTSKILNAYYLPGEARELLYPSISPVNNFRVVFDHYFGTSYGLLEDVTYWTEEKDGKVTFKVVRE